MATNHRISSNLHDRYHGTVKAKEMRSQKHEHSNMHAGMREEGVKPGPRLYDGFDKGFRLIDGSGRSHQPRDKIGGNDHRHGEIVNYGRNQNYDRHDPVGRNSHHRDAWQFSYGKPGNGLPGVYGNLQGKQTYQVTQITITHSTIFSGSHLSLEKSKEAHQNFLNAAMSFIQNPNGQAYKSLNDAMIKLMDPKFAPAVTGGAAQVKIRGVNGTTMAKFTMEVTPAPTKSLEEAREDLKNAYSSKRNGEKDIASIREEAYANYIRALSEKFKKDGVISHTNHTPTTPVFKSSVIYVVKVTQVNLTSLHEIKKPDFKHSLHGRLKFKDQRSFWNNYRQNHKSYVDMLRHELKKSHTGKDFNAGKAVGSKRHYRHADGNMAERTGHSHHKNPGRIESKRKN